MPCRPFGNEIERDPRGWQRCLDAVARQMLGEGWPPKARKFATVQHRRARRLFAESHHA